MNVFASNNVLFDGVFCRNSDDCTTVYATRMGFHGGCRNVTMQNSTLWADVAHPIFIGLHGDVDRNEVMENLTYRNIDILIIGKCKWIIKAVWLSMQVIIIWSGMYGSRISASRISGKDNW